MSKNWVLDMEEMHSKYGVHEWVKKTIASGDTEKLKAFLNFRIKTMLNEEFNETVTALENGDAEELVDGLIDLCVIAIGTLDAFGVNAEKAWNEILRANMSKDVGVKATRPNPLGLPDLIKPEGWTGPDHSDNHAILTIAMGDTSTDE